MGGVLRVTGILRRAGLVSEGFYSQEDLDRGSATHLTTEFIDKGEAFEPSDDASVNLRAGQYRAFLSDIRPEILAIEEEVTNLLYHYKGRLDRRVRIGGREGILDIKGTTPSPWHGPQLALYAMTFPRPLARWNLYLSDDHYRLIERKDRMDYEVAKAAITISRWLESLEG
jgi:hypothetical protein